jgi:hypothetical protein
MKCVLWPPFVFSNQIYWESVFVFCSALIYNHELSKVRSIGPVPRNRKMVLISPSLHLFVPCISRAFFTLIVKLKVYVEH